MIQVRPPLVLLRRRLAFSPAGHPPDTLCAVPAAAARHCPPRLHRPFPAASLGAGAAFAAGVPSLRWHAQRSALSVRVETDDLFVTLGRHAHHLTAQKSGGGGGGEVGGGGGEGGAVAGVEPFVGEARVVQTVRVTMGTAPPSWVSGANAVDERSVDLVVSNSLVRAAPGEPFRVEHSHSSVL